MATPEPTTCADIEGGCAPWATYHIDKEGHAAGYIAFWNGGPRTVCSFATAGFGALGDEHHAAARAAATAWNDAVGGEPALFAYHPDCPDGFDAAFGDQDSCDGFVVQNAREYIDYIPVIWVTAEAAGPVGVACAYINGTHNENPAMPPDRQGWKAAVIVGTGADDAVGGVGYTAAIAHELGHILYLRHTCSNVHSIMHAKSRCSTRYVPSGIVPADYLLIRAALGRN